MLGPMNRTGEIWTRTVQGITFSIPALAGCGGKRYVLEDRGGAVFFLGDLSSDPVQVYGEEEAEVRRQGDEDMEIAKNRQGRAEELSKGDRELRWVLLLAMGYANGEASSVEFEDCPEVAGVGFYKVGRNASHNFYMGFGPDGRRHFMAEQPEFGQETVFFPKEVRSFSEISYWGHS